MAGKREKPEDIVLKLRQVEVLKGSRQVGSGGRSTDWRYGADLLSLTQRVWPHIPQVNH